MDSHYIVLEFDSEDPMREPKEHAFEDWCAADHLARNLASSSALGISRVEKWTKPRWNGREIVAPQKIGETIEYCIFGGELVIDNP